MYDLNKNQRMAAEHLNGPMMVLAGPGSGKTAVISARAVLLADDTARNEGVLVITYSKAAATEMERRFKALSPSRDPVSPITFGTFHSVFFRMLKRGRNYSLDQIFSENERKNLVRGYLSEMKYSLDDETLSLVINEMSLVRNELLNPDDFYSANISAEDFRSLCRLYDEYKREKSRIDFDDMLCHAYNMLGSDADELAYWRARFPYIMIDEFQDINKVQYETVKLLAAPENNLFVVGDDDQSIYRFRGSRPEFLLNFPKDFPATKRVTLSTNYRSTDSIITYANGIISGNNKRYDKKISGTGERGPVPFVLKSEDQNSEASLISENIRDMWKKGADLDEIAVIYRLNIQARAFMDAFLNMNIPFRCRDESPTIYDHWITTDLFAFFRAAQRVASRVDMGYDPDAARIINKPFRFISKAFLQKVKNENKDIFSVYMNDPMLHAATKNNIEELYHDLMSLSRMETSSAIRCIRLKMGYNGHITDTCDYRKLNPAGLLEIADELQDAAKQYPSPMDFIAHAAQASEAARETEKPGPACTLTTLHSAKGLEFEHVFIAGVVEEILPHMRSRTPSAIEEERRLFYVGITRAKRELFLSTLKSRYDKPAKPSRFLK